MKVPETVPGGYNSAVALLYEALDDEARAFIMENPYTIAHHSLGQQIRNKWGLWNTDSMLVRWFKVTHMIGHADDISGLILQGLWAKVRGNAFDPFTASEIYVKYWREQGRDSCSLKQL